MLGAKLRENFQANDLALVSVLVATGATVLLDSYGHLPNIAARSIQRFLQRWRWRLAYQPPNQTPMPCTIPTGKNAASAIIRGRCPFVAQKMMDVSHAECATASATMIVAAVVKSIGPLEFRVIVTPAPPRLFSADGIPPARRQSVRGPAPTGLHHFDGWRSIAQATLTVYSLQRLPIDGLGLDPAPLGVTEIAAPDCRRTALCRHVASVLGVQQWTCKRIVNRDI
jgi:hypothetical protein